MKPEIIEIFNETAEQVPLSREDLSRLTDLIRIHEQRNFLTLEVVFVNDSEILEMNRKYLGHDYVTDIITFPYHENEEPVEGTLFCCLTQISRQSRELNTEFGMELLRVVIHGLLHLVGYDDETEQQRNRMHSLENKYITLYQDF